MHVFWLNGGLVLHPDTETEGEALSTLYDGVVVGRPDLRDQGGKPEVEPAEERRRTA